MPTAPALIIDKILQVYSDTDPFDQDAQKVRDRVASFLDLMDAYIHNYREWRWTFKTDTLIVPANDNVVELWPDFMEFGQNGGLWDSDRRIRLVEKQKYVIERMLQEGNPSFAPWFCLSEGNVQLPYTPTSAVNLVGKYRFTHDEVVDQGTNLIIPDAYVRTVIIPGTLARLQESKNDARMEMWNNQFISGLSQMCARERPGQTGVQRMPMAVRGAW